MVDNKIVDSVYTIKILRCISSSPFGLRLGIGYSRFNYNDGTSDWIKNHAAPDFNISLAIENANLGFRFKPWSTNPKKSLDINGESLPILAKLNPVKLDYYISYNFNLQNNIALEPALGYSKSLFIVINEDDLGKEFNIPSIGGLMTSFTLSKYLRFKYNEFFAIYGNVEYAFIDYSKLNPDLGKGYFNWTIGLAFKGYFKKLILQRI